MNDETDTSKMLMTECGQLFCENYLLNKLIINK